jgi:hypothetical protein
MNYFNSNTEKSFNEKIIRFFDLNNVKDKFSIIYQANLSKYTSTPTKKIVDFLILKGEYPFSIVEVVSPNDTFGLEKHLKNSDIDTQLIGADYFLVTNLETSILYNYQEKVFDYIILENFFGLLLKELNEEEIQYFKAGIANQIVESIASLKDNFRILDYQLNDFANNLSYNSQGRFFHFSTNPSAGLNDFENLFFQKILKHPGEQVVCRYTTLENLYTMINKNLFRMASHLSMNDRGEIDYADKYLDIYYKPLPNLSLKEMRQLNRSYISSCTNSSKKDDLLMYRLYGDDTKGVCLCFEVTYGLQLNNLIIERVSYARKDKKHPELDLIKKIIENTESKFRVRFRFLYLDIWKHFFKSCDYEFEQEIRLLYFDNNLILHTSQGWVISSPDKILSKYVLFNLNDHHFPLKLNKIILGPNCPESQLNKRQLEVMLDEKGFSKVSVAMSEIESYRKS